MFSFWHNVHGLYPPANLKTKHAVFMVPGVALVENLGPFCQQKTPSWFQFSKILKAKVSKSERFFLPNTGKDLPSECIGAKITCRVFYSYKSIIFSLDHPICAI